MVRLLEYIFSVLFPLLLRTHLHLHVHPDIIEKLNIQVLIKAFIGITPECQNYILVYHDQIKYVPEAMHLPAIKLQTQDACRMTTFTVASCLCNGFLGTYNIYTGTYNLMVCSCM